MDNLKNDVAIIKFIQYDEQYSGCITRVVGYAKIRSLINLIDVLDLDANPRSSKVGTVTNDIQDSIENTPDIFPFKTKGLLVASSEYEQLERHRYRLHFKDRQTEGILDGGHNALAIGLYVLRLAMDAANHPFPRSIKTWSDFKSAWYKFHDLIDQYLKDTRKDEDDTESVTRLDVLVPIELLLPRDQNDSNCLDEFNSNLLDICNARNNNVQLTVSTKANKHGYFDAFKKLLSEQDPDVEKRIEWKTNDGGDIKAADVIALAWIPLSLLPSIPNKSGKPFEAPNPVQLYSSKAVCLNKFEQFMSLDSVSSQGKGYQRELSNPSVYSAFQIAVQLPRLYDHIYATFPRLYNKNGGSYGKINAVKSLNRRHNSHLAPYGHEQVEYLSPDGFITPLVYGLRALMTVEQPQKQNEYPRVVWIQDPLPWLDQHLASIIKRYVTIFTPWGYDPQKIGKSIGSYQNALDDYKLALAGIE